MHWAEWNFVRIEKIRAIWGQSWYGSAPAGLSGHIFHESQLSIDVDYVEVGSWGNLLNYILYPSNRFSNVRLVVSRSDSSEKELFHGVTVRYELRNTFFQFLELP